jgi:hypothetical protein
MDGKWIRKPQSDVSAVFVHGLQLRGEPAWRHANGCYWPEMLAKETGLEPLGVYVFTYQANLSSGDYGITDAVDALKEQMKLDGVRESGRLVFICYSMGGIVVRKFLVQRAAELSNAGKEIDLFLIASPSLGSRYADWLSLLARRHAQVRDLRSIENNTWLQELDKEFINLQHSVHLKIKGKELVEDKGMSLGRFNLGYLLDPFRKPVVEQFSAARYFGERIKIPGSDHFSIARPKDSTALQHRLLVNFIQETTSFKLLHIKTEFKNAASMLGHPVLYEFLEHECAQKTLFPGASLKMLRQPVGSTIIPMAVAVFAKGVPVRLGNLDARVWSSKDLEIDDYIKKRDAMIGNSLIGKTDKIIYTARRIITTSDACEIEGGLTTYLSGLKVHHALMHELLLNAYRLHNNNNLSVEALESGLIKRRNFFASTEIDQVRYRPISISALVIYKSEDEGYKIIVRKRSARVAVDPEMIQAIPSFTFQAEVDPKREWNVRHCLMKEYAEELFNEQVDETRADTPEFISQFKAAKDLRNALKTGQCELLYSGVVLDLMRWAQLSEQDLRFDRWRICRG